MNQPSRVIAQAVSGIAFAIVLWAVIEPPLAHPLRWQWDFSVYYNAALAQEHGGDPYGALPQLLHFDPPLRFVYPPILAWVFEPFTALGYVTATRVFLGLKLIAMVGLLRLLASRFVAPPSQTSFALFGLLAFGAALSADLQSGNVSTFEQVAIWWGFWFLLTGRLWAFCACIVGASLFKIVPIVFLAALLLHPEPRRFRFLAGAILCFMLGMLAQELVAPGEFGEFLGNVSALAESGSRGNLSSLAFSQDAFDGMRHLGGLRFPAWAPALAWVTLVAGVVLVTARVFRGNRFDGSARDALRIALLCSATALTLPRFKTYSYALLVAPGWCAAGATARGRRAVQAVCLGVLCLSDAAPLLRIAGSLGLTGALAPGRGWWFVPLVQAGLTWIALLVAVHRRQMTSGVEAYSLLEPVSVARR